MITPIATLSITLLTTIFLFITTIILLVRKKIKLQQQLALIRSEKQNLMDYNENVNLSTRNTPNIMNTSVITDNNIAYCHTVTQNKNKDSSPLNVVYEVIKN